MLKTIKTAGFSFPAVTIGAAPHPKKLYGPALNH